MQLTDIFFLGNKFFYLMKIPSVIKGGFRVTIFGERGYIENLEKILSILEKYSLSKTTQTGIKSYIKGLKEKYPDEDEERSINIEEIDTLSHLSSVWCDRVLSELDKIVVFRAFTDGRLNATKLCEGAKTFFQTTIWRKLPKIVKEDLEESAKCLLTQAWTASGLMSMRALESGVRKYYTEITGNSGEDKTYGQMTGELRNNQDADNKLIGYLDYLKDTRNDLAHPNIRINQFKAEQAFQHTIEVSAIVFK